MTPMFSRKIQPEPEIQIQNLWNAQNVMKLSVDEDIFFNITELFMEAFHQIVRYSAHPLKAIFDFQNVSLSFSHPHNQFSQY